MYSHKQRNNYANQTILVTSDNYTLLDDYKSINVQLPYPVVIPSIGCTTIQLQKLFFSSTGMLPANNDFLFVYLSTDVRMSNKVVCESSVSEQLVGVAPIIAGGAQYYIADNDSNIVQELYDNQTFQNFKITIANKEGVPIKFSDNIKPILQFGIQTDYTEKISDGGRLVVDQRFGR